MAPWVFRGILNGDLPYFEHVFGKPPPGYNLIYKPLFVPCGLSVSGKGALLIIAGIDERWQREILAMVFCINPCVREFMCDDALHHLAGRSVDEPVFKNKTTSSSGRHGRRPFFHAAADEVGIKHEERCGALCPIKWMNRFLFHAPMCLQQAPIRFGNPA